MSDLQSRLAALSPAKQRLFEAMLRDGAQAREPIAIVGMGCRFPGASNLDDFWRVVAEGIETSSEIPEDRWPAELFYDPDWDAPGKMVTKWCCFVDGVDQFDPVFFGITPREASRMDPQQRLLLEVAWEAVEHAGISARRLADSPTGVFVGIGQTDYGKIPAQYDNFLEYIDAHVGTGNALSIAANRLSYILNLKGPSVAVDTACSSALVAVHLAVRSLRDRECDTALVGAVNAILSPDPMICLSKARMLSATGTCRPFDAGANGYVRGEGCGVVVLKRLSDAVAAEDRILATLLGTAVNHDGRTSGITAPNGDSQRRVIQAALSSANIAPDAVDYIEAHGTGTPLGDPIEVDALRKVFRRATPADPPVYLTSVKANIGHLEIAAGIAGLIKAVLQIQHGRIQPQWFLDSLNPHIRLEGSRIEIPRDEVKWEAGQRRRIGSVSSFGFGGTNAHVVLEAPRRTEPSSREHDRPYHLLALSAKTKKALKTLSASYAEALRETPREDLGDFCHTANVGRFHHNVRLAVRGDSHEALMQALDKVADDKKSPLIKQGQVRIPGRPKLAFLCTGQGSQYIGMGRGLFETQPVFRRALEHCDEILRAERNQSLLSILYPDEGDDSPINQTEWTQPALFALEYALAELWRGWGLEPDVAMGHSVGEYVAACVAGVFPVQDGLRLIAKRAELMQQLPGGGGMAVVFAPAERVREMLDRTGGDVSVAAVNGPENTTISGALDELEPCLTKFKEAGMGVQKLAVSHAFHSHLMEPMLDEFERYAEQMTFQPPQIPVVCNLTGQLAQPGTFTASYWRRHIRHAVQFTACIDKLRGEDVHGVVELGPTPSLIGMARRCSENFNVSWLPSLRKGKEDWQVMLGSLAELYVLGADIDWAGFDRGWKYRRLTLPTYPFENSRYWFEPQGASRDNFLERLGANYCNPLLGVPVGAAESTFYQVHLRPWSPKYLSDHQVQGSPIAPGAVFLEQGLAAAEQAFGEGNHALENVSLQGAMYLSDEASRVVQVTLAPDGGGRREFKVHSQPEAGANGAWMLHARGTLCHADTLRDDSPSDIDLDAVQERCFDTKTAEAFYELMRQRGLEYGPAFQMLGDMRRGHGVAISEVRLPASIVDDLEKLTRHPTARYYLHPVLGDACMQAMAGVVPLEKDGSYSPYTYLPVSVRHLRVFGNPADGAFVYVVRASEDDAPSPDKVEGDVFLTDQNGKVLVAMTGVKAQRLTRSDKTGQTDIRDWFYGIRWDAQALPGPEETAETGNEGKQQDAEPVATEEAQRVCLLLADRQGVAAHLARHMQPSHAMCLLVEPGGTFAHREPEQEGAAHRLQIDPLDEQHYHRIAELLGEHLDGKKLDIVHLFSLDIPAPEGAGERALSETRRLGCGSVLLLLKQVARIKFSRAPSIWLVTAGAQAVSDEEHVAVAQTPLVGMGRVATLEFQEQNCRLVDVDPDGTSSEWAATLKDEILSADNENQVAYRGGVRYVARLERTPDVLEGEEGDEGDLTIPTGSPFRLHVGSHHTIDGLRFKKFRRIEPGPDQVEIQVNATGLNFSDVLKAIGLYPGITDEVVPLGIECSGVVTRVGEAVDRFAVGDEVMGVAPYSFASHCISADYALVHKPKNLDHCEAATVPITFLTAYYALRRLANLRQDERVLIHAGAGGVGLAAIQIAQDVGAEIFTTAGSDEKREYLRSLGVPHVMNSRTLEFAEEIMDITERQGVDVVLNSLPGDAIERSLAVLRAYGRFLEIGKIDIYQNRMIGLLPFQDNLTYSAIDLDRMLRQRPDYIRGLFEELMRHFRDGVYQPLNRTQFSVADVAEGFRFMSRRKNIGKIVIALEGEQTEQRDQAEAEDAVREDGSYLITGGLGALGLRTAEWLIDQGARHVVLMSRRPPAPEAAERIDAMCQRGAHVAAVQGDVADFDSLASALNRIPEAFPPLRGILHAAGVLADRLMVEMDLAQLDKPMAAKVQGAWNLHRATLDAPLDFFVMFSSVSAILGTAGQGNYAAGNAFLDGLAHYRRSQGWPAISVNWGAWAGAGMASDVADDMKARGVTLLPPESCFEILEHALDTKPVQTTVFIAEWPKLLRLYVGGPPPLLRDMESVEAEAEGSSAESEALRRELLEMDPQRREQRLLEFFAALLAETMGMEPEDLDLIQPLNTLGLDSLMAIELRNKLETQLKVTLPMALFMESPSVSRLAEFVAQAIDGESGETLASDQEPESRVDDASSTAVTLLPDAKAASDWSPLVRLQTGGDRLPIFLLHPAGGSVYCYHGLVEHLEEDVPVYALQGRGLESGQAPHASWEDMVSEQTEAILRVRDTGPYHLAGWSTGGVLAYAVAEKLQAAGASIDMIAMFDSRTPIWTEIDPDDDVRVLELIDLYRRFRADEHSVSRKELSKLNSDERLQLILDRARDAGLAGSDISVKQIRRFLEAAKANLRALLSYTPQPSQLPVDQFRAVHDCIEDGLSLGWQDVVPETLSVHLIHAGHYDIMTGEHAKSLAEHVMQRVRNPMREDAAGRVTRSEED